MHRPLVSVLALGLALLAVTAPGCRRQESSREGQAGRTRIVFKHQPLWGDPAPFRELLDGFRRANPDVELVAELIPNASDLAHQFFLTSLDA